ncbi:Alpha-galactosidase [Hordeum vulgare]|nr:Alpha-galactosidase [Hordeum vulgare]
MKTQVSASPLRFPIYQESGWREGHFSPRPFPTPSAAACHWFLQYAAKDFHPNPRAGSVNLSIKHMVHFVDLWVHLEQFQIITDMEDDISWKFEAKGEYSAAFAYRIQFLGSMTTTMNKTIWKVWAPPKVNFFSWLAIQNRIWMANRLEKRGWENCGLCTLCRRDNETAAHLFYRCRFMLCVWRLVKEWLGLGSMDTRQWSTEPNVKY